MEETRIIKNIKDHQAETDKFNTQFTELRDKLKTLSRSGVDTGLEGLQGNKGWKNNEALHIWIRTVLDITYKTLNERVMESLARGVQADAAKGVNFEIGDKEIIVTYTIKYSLLILQWFIGIEKDGIADNNGTINRGHYLFSNDGIKDIVNIVIDSEKTPSQLHELFFEPRRDKDEDSF